MHDLNGLTGAFMLMYNRGSVLTNRARRCDRLAHAGAGVSDYGAKIVPRSFTVSNNRTVPMQQYDNICTPAAELDFPAPPPTRPSRRIVFREYVFGVSARAAWYGALAGLAIGVVLTALGYMLEAPWYLLTATALACTLLGAGGYGVITLNGAWRSFVAEFGHEPMRPEPVRDKPKPYTVPTENQDTITFATLDGRIINFQTQEKRNILRWWREALADETKVSLGKNDAMRLGVTGDEWASIFGLLQHFELVEERKNQKPVITLNGYMALERYLRRGG